MSNFDVGCLELPLDLNWFYTQGKSLKQKLQDRIAKAIIAKKGVLSNLEHEAIVSRIKTKLDQAHAEMLEAMGAVPKSML